MTDTLSETMKLAFNTAQEHGGKLERLPGGFWTYSGCERRPNDGIPNWHVGTTTVQALVDRRRMVYSQHKTSRDGGGRFPVEAMIVPGSSI